MNETQEVELYQANNPPSAQSARKMKEKNAECVMAKASKALESINARYQNPSQENTVNKRNEDGLFADMVYEMLTGIPDCMQKAMIKIEFQQKLMQLKYSTAQACHPNTNYFPMTQYQGYPNTFSDQRNANSSAHSTASYSSANSPLASPTYQKF